MGLAPYGRDKLVGELADLVSRTPDGLFRVNLAWFSYHREGGWLSGQFLDRFGPPRKPESAITERDQDLAFAVQDLLEETALHLARTLRRRSGQANLCLAGGVALNSVMNTRLLREAGFERIFVQPAASDAGNALGAALWVWHQQLGRPRGPAMTHAFHGADWTEREQAEVLAGQGLEVRQVADPAEEAARLLAETRIVGWFQGRAEVGPRALGARSILAWPRPGMRPSRPTSPPTQASPSTSGSRWMGVVAVTSVRTAPSTTKRPTAAFRPGSRDVLAWRRPPVDSSPVLSPCGCDADRSGRC
jgi:carbamoyltransferase